MFILLFVLVDFLEVLVGIHLQLAAGSLVAGNDAIGMQLQSADGPCMIYATLYAMTQGTSLVLTIDETIQRYLEDALDQCYIDTKCDTCYGIIMDVDTGIDDAVAIILAMASPQIDLKGITVVAGNQIIEKTAFRPILTKNRACPQECCFVCHDGVYMLSSRILTHFPPNSKQENHTSSPTSGIYYSGN